LIQIAGRLLNGFDEHQIPLGVKASKDNVLTNGYIKVTSLLILFQEYAPSITLNNTGLLIYYLELPLKSLDSVKYQDLSSALYQFMDTHNLRSPAKLKMFFSQVPIASVATLSGPKLVEQGNLVQNKINDYLSIFRQKLKILSSDDAVDLFNRMDTDKSQTVSEEEFLVLVSNKIPEIPTSVLPEIYKFFSRSDPKGVTKSNFVRALIEIKLVDRNELLFERTKWADILFKKIGE
jgi:hypothetical protein